jgi:hypothetical protein
MSGKKKKVDDTFTLFGEQIPPRHNFSPRIILNYCLQIKRRLSVEKGVE